jgi:hypothetical protein
MKLNLINSITVLLLLVTLISCDRNNKQSQQSESDSSKEAIFPKGELGPATNFTGNAFNFGLVAMTPSTIHLWEMFISKKVRDQTGTYIQAGKF